MKKALSVVLCLVLLIGLLPTASHAIEQSPVRYGYAKLENEQQQYVYELMVSCIAAHQERVELDIGKQVTEADADLAIQMLIRDYPEFFWYYQKSYAFQQTQDGIMMSISPVYMLHEQKVSYDDSALASAIADFNDALDGIMNSVPAGLTSHYEIALYLHDALAKHVIYADGRNDQTAYGALVEGNSVCAGYARAYQCLLNRAGIDSWFVTGQSYNPSGILENHAWNLVSVYDELTSSYQCLYTDVTWDDQGEKLFHMYFNCGGEEFMDSHFPDDFSLAYLPACDHEGHDYFSKKHGPDSGAYNRLSDATTAAQAANNFSPMSVKNGIGTRQLDIYYVGSDFAAWLNQNLSQMGTLLGFAGNLSCQYAALGSEYQLTVSGTPADPVIEVSSIGITQADVELTKKGQTHQLTAVIEPADATDKTVVFESQNPQIASVDPHTGVVTAHSNGTTNIVARSSNGMQATCRIIVSIAAPEIGIGVENGAAYLEDGTQVDRAAPGTKIVIRADAAPEGMEFAGWSIKLNYGVELADPTKEETTFTMPDQGLVLLEAYYRSKTVHVTGVRLDQQEIALPSVGSMAVLTATVEPADATVQKLIWVSKDPQVVTVTDGHLVAVGTGTAEVTVTTQDGGFVAVCVVTVARHVHDEVLQQVAEKKPTCTEKGYLGHYICASCGVRFKDEKGTELILSEKEITVAALGHTPSTWHFDEEKHWQVCTAEGCGAIISESTGIHIDTDKNGACDTCGSAVATTAPTQPPVTQPSEPSTEPSVTDPQPTMPNHQSGEGDSGWIIWLIVSLVLAAVAVAGWLFLKKRKQ